MTCADDIGVDADSVALDEEVLRMLGMGGMGGGSEFPIGKRRTPWAGLSGKPRGPFDLSILSIALCRALR